MKEETHLKISAWQVLPRVAALAVWAQQVLLSTHQQAALLQAHQLRQLSPEACPLAHPAAQQMKYQGLSVVRLRRLELLTCQLQRSRHLRGLVRWRQCMSWCWQALRCWQCKEVCCCSRRYRLQQLVYQGVHPEQAPAAGWRNGPQSSVPCPAVHPGLLLVDLAVEPPLAKDRQQLGVSGPVLHQPCVRHQVAGLLPGELCLPAVGYAGPVRQQVWLQGAPLRWALLQSVMMHGHEPPFESLSQ